MSRCAPSEQDRRSALVNKRARNRLIGVTAIIIIAVGAIIYGTQMMGVGGSFARTASQLAADTKLVGQRVQVSGPVVGGSWDKQTNPMKFTISDVNPKPGSATIKVVYNGGVPTTFSDGTVAIVTGTLRKGGVVEAQTLLTKCPSKYEGATDALTVDKLVSQKAAETGHPSKVTGFVVAGSDKAVGGPVRFEISDAAQGSQKIPVKYDGALPAGFKDGANLVVTGTLGADGTYAATQVSIASAAAAK
jgi:cytochrome c-type biogenesis protein CcmE